MLSDALSSSGFAIAAKRAGFDAYALVGRAQGATRLCVDDGRVWLESASEWVGRPAIECDRPGWSTAAIGPAGEHGVRYATISNDGRHAGRGGLGALMGSKNLKAFSIRGSQPTPLADPEGVARAARTLVRSSMGAGTAKYRELGTVSNLAAFNRLGVLPTRNFQEERFEGSESLTEQSLQGEGGSLRASCAACTIGCEHRFAGRSGAPVRVEYESLFALGPLLGIADREAVLEAAARCDALGLDTISAGGTLAFAMEVGYAGLSFGDAAGALSMLERIASREGDGDLLAEGSRRAAIALGREPAAMQVKGLEIPGYHPRGLPAMALGFAVGTRGADHNRSGAYQLDFSEGSDRRELAPGDLARMVEIENFSAALDSLILCKFLRGAFDDPALEIPELVRGVTARSIDLQTLGASVFTLRKVFNMWSGWRPEDDGLPERMLEDESAAKRLRDRIRGYNLARGWSEEGHVSEHVLRTWRESGLLPS
jgi:aldehyde:ferredoxin oxidoreductase